MSESTTASASVEIEDLQRNKRDLERHLESAQAKIKYLEFDQKANRDEEKYKIKYENLKESAEKQQESYYSSLAALKIKAKDEEHRAARIQSELLSANKVAEKWNTKYESEKENREKLANQLLESNKLTNEKSEEIEKIICELERYRNLYNDLCEKYNNERFLSSDIKQEKSILSVQNQELSKSLNDKENMLSELSGHHNKKQKINYLQNIREENSSLRHEKFELQTTNQKLESRIKIVEEDLRFYKTEKIKLFSK